MELKVNEHTFYLLDAGEEKWLFDTEESAIGSLKKLVANGGDVDPEKVSIFEVNTSGEQWGITSVPWSKIAIGLMKGGK
jgi:hypothetical protein